MAKFYELNQLSAQEAKVVLEKAKKVKLDLGKAGAKEIDRFIKGALFREN